MTHTERAELALMTARADILEMQAACIHGGHDVIPPEMADRFMAALVRVIAAQEAVIAGMTADLTAIFAGATVH